MKKEKSKSKSERTPKVKQVLEKKKRGRPPAEWLLNLKPGIYSTEQLVIISKRNRITVRDSLRLHGAEVFHKQQGPHLVAYFKWDGFKDE